jgi:SAM-dependent methyltransferase
MACSSLVKCNGSESETMISVPKSSSKILVVLASYGVTNDRYLSQLVAEFQSMSFHVDIIVLSNLAKEVAPGVETVVIDLEGTNPWSLPFAHKRIFADRLKDYDVFIYAEDDTLITEKNVRAFLQVSEALPQNEIPGFLRFELGPDGKRNFPEVHGHFHWDPASVRCRSEHVLAFFTNEHAACYALTRPQLRRAINSGGFLVGPHEGKYDLLCTAATDPYTQCGLEKLICISRLDDFMVHHLPNRYVGTTFGVDGDELCTQIGVLLGIAKNGHPPTSLFNTETKLKYARYSKNYYEPIIPELISAIPKGARSVLSVGCASGKLEIELLDKGLRVVGVPLDTVISRSAESKGVEMVRGDVQAAREQLSGERFDCVVVSNVLHLVPSPVAFLTSLRKLLSDEGLVLAIVPNTERVEGIRRTTSDGQCGQRSLDYEKTGVQRTSCNIVRRWFRNAGMGPTKVDDIMSPRARTIGRMTLGLANHVLASEFIVSAKKGTLLSPDPSEARS